MLDLQLSTGQKLRLPSGAGILLEWNNPLFVSVAERKRSYAYPFDIPKTPENVAALGYIGEPVQQGNFLSVYDAQLRYNGLPIASGDLVLRKYFQDRFQVSLQLSRRFDWLADSLRKRFEAGVFWVGEKKIRFDPGVPSSSKPSSFVYNLTIVVNGTAYTGELSLDDVGGDVALFRPGLTTLLINAINADATNPVTASTSDSGNTITIEVDVPTDDFIVTLGAATNMPAAAPVTFTGSATAAIATINDITNNGHPIVCYPSIHQPNIKEAAVTPSFAIVNDHDGTTHIDTGVVSLPQPKLKPILAKIVEANSWTITFEDDGLFDDLCIYNNAYVGPGRQGGQYFYCEMLPDISLRDLLDSLAVYFNLSINYDYISQSITVRRNLNSLFTEPFPILRYTPEYEVEPYLEAGVQYKFDVDESIIPEGYDELYLPFGTEGREIEPSVLFLPTDDTRLQSAAGISVKIWSPDPEGFSNALDLQDEPRTPINRPVFFFFTGKDDDGKPQGSYIGPDFNLTWGSIVPTFWQGWSEGLVATQRIQQIAYLSPSELLRIDKGGRVRLRNQTGTIVKLSASLPNEPRELIAVELEYIV